MLLMGRGCDSGVTLMLGINDTQTKTALLRMALSAQPATQTTATDQYSKKKHKQPCAVAKSLHPSWRNRTWISSSQQTRHLPSESPPFFSSSLSSSPPPLPSGSASIPSSSNIFLQWCRIFSWGPLATLVKGSSSFCNRESANAPNQITSSSRRTSRKNTRDKTPATA